MNILDDKTDIMRRISSIALALTVILFYSCAEKSPNQESRADNELVEKAEEPIKEHLEKAYYPIPSPEQMFGFINDNGIEYSKELISDIELSRSFNDPQTKAIVFGIYTADLAYAAAYQDIESTIDLYKIVKRLSADLQIEEMMTDEMMERVQSNFQNPDSLAIIAGNSYYESVEFMENHGQIGKLALMSLGGWIESLYITLNAMENLDNETLTAQRVADQKITFGNLYTYLKKNESEIGVQQAISDIQKVRSVFASLVEVKVAKKEDESSKVVFGGNSRINITTNQLAELKDAINEYRMKIIDTKV